MTVISNLWKVFKWFAKTLLVVLGIFPFFRCSSGYKEKDGKLMFDGEVITNKSFIVLSKDFGKDSTTAYYRSYPFRDVDVATFKAVDEHYAKDKSKVYYCDEYRESQNYYLTKRQTILDLDNVIPDHFASLGHGYATDTKRAWFEGVPFAVKDIATLRSINTHFANDDVQAYYDRTAIAGSDGKTFQVINDEYAKDIAHIYFYGFTGVEHAQVQRLLCDKETFKILAYPYSKDATSVFYRGRQIKNAHAPTFKILKNGYAIDNDAVYYETAKIGDANPTYFAPLAVNDSIVNEFSYAKDNQTVFLGKKKIKDADGKTFRVLGLGYGCDSHHIFYKTNIVTGAIPESFKIYEHGYGDADSQDSQHHYLEGKIVMLN